MVSAHRKPPLNKYAGPTQRQRLLPVSLGKWRVIVGNRLAVAKGERHLRQLLLLRLQECGLVRDRVCLTFIWGVSRWQPRPLPFPRLTLLLPEGQR